MTKPDPCPIPLVDLTLQHTAVAAEIERGFASVLERAAFVLGDEVASFEQEYAAYARVAHCVGVANGTDALELALRAAGVEPGSEVIVPTNSFVSSAVAVLRAGATPTLVDVDDDTLLIDPAAVADAIGTRTAAIMPVHLFGQVAPMQQVLALAVSAGVAVVEDAAQSHGATQDGRPAGGFGAIAGTSFYPGKNLGAYGDAGGVLTNDAGFADFVVAARNHGREAKTDNRELGFNSRLDTLQAVVLRAKLRYLDAWNDERRRAAAVYDELLADVEEARLPVTACGNVHVWHVYAIRVAERDRVLAHLNAHGIGATIHYKVPIHLEAAFAPLGLRSGTLPVAERAATELLSLPIFPGITPTQQQRVADELVKVLRSRTE